MEEEELKKAIEHYRTLVQKEIEGEKSINGQLIGPHKLEKRQIDLEDMIRSNRHFFSKKVGKELDSSYVTTFRVGNLKKPAAMTEAGCGSDLVGGMEFGSSLVKNGHIKRLEDIVQFLANFKMGIFDIFEEENTKDGKKLDLRVYECIDCAGLPNVGKPVCYFETGMIIGIIRELTHKEISAEEIRCWTSGYSFCHFSVEIKD